MTVDMIHPSKQTNNLIRGIVVCLFHKGINSFVGLVWMCKGVNVVGEEVSEGVVNGV